MRPEYSPHTEVLGAEFCFPCWDVCLGPSGGCGEPPRDAWGWEPSSSSPSRAVPCLWLAPRSPQPPAPQQPHWGGQGEACRASPVGSCTPSAGTSASGLLPKQRVNTLLWPSVLSGFRCSWNRKTWALLLLADPFLLSACGLGIRAFGSPVGTASSSCLPGL